MAKSTQPNPSRSPKEADPSSSSTGSELAEFPQGPGFGITFLYYFVGTAAVTTFLAMKTLGLPLDTGIPNQFGLVFGVVGGLVGATVNRTAQLTLPFKRRQAAIDRLEAALTDMGYCRQPEAGWEDVWVYRRPALRQLLSGQVFVQVGDKAVQVSSRALHIRGLKRRLQ